MYKEFYIPDGPEGAVKYDHALGAQYRIENGKRVYTSDHEMHIVPPDDDRFHDHAIRLVAIIMAIILASFITIIIAGISLLTKLFSHV